MAAISESDPAVPTPLLLAVLLWPALENGYPLVFSDSGTYISQIVEHHLGWDRPPFYSLFLFLCGWGYSPWPAIVVQATLVAWVLRRWLRRMPGLPGWAACAVLGLGTALPFTAAQIMPDVFAPLAVVSGFLLLEGGLARREVGLLAAIGAGAMTLHLTIAPIFVGTALVWALRTRLWRRLWLIAALTAASAGALAATNLLAHREPVPAPYAATFYLARLIEDGPARVELARDCGARHWALCASLSQLPASADDFLWRPDSPLYRDGGPRLLIGDTKAIIAATLAAMPGTVLRDGVRDAAWQLVSFRTGDGLNAWPATAGATIARDFPPASAAAYRAGRQARGLFAPPAWLVTLDEAVALAGVALSLLGAVLLRREAAGRFCAMALAALLINAVLTGAFSGPHDRYQSRMMWLAVAAGMATIARLRRMVQRLWGSMPASRTTYIAQNGKASRLRQSIAWEGR